MWYSQEMRVLIAGGAGFLGTNLSLRLLADGHLVVVIDNFCTGKRTNTEFVKDKFPNTFEVIEHDITKELSLFEKFDVVVNMACPASPPAYQRMPIECLRVSSVGTENLLKLAKETNARFVQASTSEVYGEPQVHPQEESYWGNVNSYGVRSMYDEGKRYAEALIYSFRRVYGLNTGIVRIFNTYGPFMDPEDGRVVTNFLHQALEGKDLTVYGDGKQTRSFCFVDDQIDAWIKMINSQEEGPINVGNPQEFTMLELVEAISKVLGKDLKVVYKPKPVDDPTQRRPDITKAKNLLGWEPKIPLDEGLKRMVRGIKK